MCNWINIYLRGWKRPHTRWSPTESYWRGRCRRADSRGTAARLSARCTADMRPPPWACWASWWCTPPETEKWPKWLNSTWFCRLICAEWVSKRVLFLSRISDVSPLTGSGAVGVTNYIFRLRSERRTKMEGSLLPPTVRQRGVERGKMIYSDSISRWDCVNCVILIPTFLAEMIQCITSN